MLLLSMSHGRKLLVSLQDTPYYHLIGRWVRRAWLWGFDEYAGKDYSHRKQWVSDRLARLSKPIFCIEFNRGCCEGCRAVLR